MFGSLLDRQAGFFRFAPFGINHPAARAYEPGTNVLVTTWKTPSGLVSALSIIGEKQRARDSMERLLRIASPLGLYAEEFESDSARHLGNFPQAFSHLALIEAAARIILSERLEEVT